MFKSLFVLQTERYPHIIRQLYWSSLPPGTYDYDMGTDYLKRYYDLLVDEIRKIVSAHSRMYWLHLSRRILPDSSGRNKSPATISITRRILDAAYQKYGLKGYCDAIGFAYKDNIDQVLDGLLLKDGFQYERELLLNIPGQMVLTKFSPANYIEYFELEKLAYEIWRCGAALRILSKGANLIVDHKNMEFYLDDRSSELDDLLTNYDNRREPFLASKKGVVVINKSEDIKGGIIPVPMYNINRESADFLKSIFNMCGIRLKLEGHMVSNFTPISYPMKTFYHNNRPLFNAFHEMHDVSVLSILCVITAICLKVMRELIVEKQVTIIESMFTRGYQGPFQEDEIVSSVISFQKDVNQVLQVTEEDKYNIDIQAGYDFLRLSSTESISLLYPGPFKMLIPVTTNKVLIDLSKITDILDGIMFGVKIENQNFKGTLLERAVGYEQSILPENLCKAKDNSTRQVDHAFSIDDILVIVECKLKEMSVGYFKGTKKSINVRTEEVVVKSIKEADDKAVWLANHPVGRNYNISNFKYIIPLGLSAYKEFIHTKEEKYWLNPELPRVMTIYELEDLKGSSRDTLLSYWNIININHIDLNTG